ncbi:hypothetical protein RIR_jg15190.t1 [Rhizophagus irregularis DAOM 181602=DAOM 197198]|nr:hypothetical protein RIR_jg15190.t1 [Rhizophagus irregularis DAOM 181602=DAOM 197198]
MQGHSVPTSENPGSYLDARIDRLEIIRVNAIREDGIREFLLIMFTTHSHELDILVFTNVLHCLAIDRVIRELEEAPFRMDSRHYYANLCCFRMGGLERNIKTPSSLYKPDFLKGRQFLCKTRTFKGKLGRREGCNSDRATR